VIDGQERHGRENGKVEQSQSYEPDDERSPNPDRYPQERRNIRKLSLGEINSDALEAPAVPRAEQERTPEGADVRRKQNQPKRESPGKRSGQQNLDRDRRLSPQARRNRDRSPRPGTSRRSTSASG
jgi:hypothetical protein